MSPSRPPTSEVSDRPRPLPGSRRTVERALADNAGAMLRAARRLSLCEDDAHDAVQAAAERFLRYAETVDLQNVDGWLVTVARNEALRVRERRLRVSGRLDDDDRRLAQTGAGPEDLVTRDEELAVAREALARLKPHERQALWRQAEGRSYDEIAQEFGWSRTKVNRLLTEGRASLRQGLRGIAAGEGCALAGPRIDRLAAGTASAEDLRALRPHVRRCPSCRARLRRARGGRWSLLPPVLLTWLPWAGRIGSAPPARTRMVEAVADRLVAVVPATSGAVSEAGLALTAGLAAVALGTGMVAGGHEHHHRSHRAQAAAPPATAAPANVSRPAVLTPASAALPRITSIPTSASSHDADARRARLREAAKRRAARRRAAKKRAAARRRAAATHAGAPSSSSSGATGSASGSGTVPGGASGADVTPPRPGGAASSPAGSAGDEFGFE